MTRDDKYLAWLRGELERADAAAKELGDQRKCGYRDAIKTALEIYEAMKP